MQWLDLVWEWQFCHNRHCNISLGCNIWHTQLMSVCTATALVALDNWTERLTSVNTRNTVSVSVLLLSQCLRADGHGKWAARWSSTEAEVATRSGWKGWAGPRQIINSASLINVTCAFFRMLYKIRQRTGGRLRRVVWLIMFLTRFIDLVFRAQWRF